MRNLIKILFAVIFTSVLFVGCTKDNNPVSPQLENISGKWEGPITHPAYDGGTVRLSILDDNGSISGTFTMRLSKNNFVQNYSGSVSGAKVISNNYSLQLEGSNFTWICDLNLNSKSLTLSGDWESNQNSGIQGTVSVDKQ